jgi:hypothetical protein
MKRVKKTNQNQTTFDWWNDITIMKNVVNHFELRLKEIDTENERIKSEISWRNTYTK